MKARNGASKPRHQAKIEPPARGKPITQRLLIEPPHLDDPINRRSRPIECERSVRLARHGTNANIYVRRRSAIEPDFLLAHGFAAIGSREIEIVVFHRALQLQRPTAQEYNCRMGVDALNRRITNRRQERDDRRLIFDNHRRVVSCRVASQDRLAHARVVMRGGSDGATHVARRYDDAYGLVATSPR